MYQCIVRYKDSKGWHEYGRDKAKTKADAKEIGKSIGRNCYRSHPQCKLKVDITGYNKEDRQKYRF